MMLGSFSGHPVAKAVTKSADVDRFVVMFPALFIRRGRWRSPRFSTLPLASTRSPIKVD
jgi:hypothetical protein